MRKLVRLLDVNRDGSFRKDFDRLVQQSAESQNLLHPITCWGKLSMSSDKVFILIDHDEVAGYIRTGRRKLYLTADPCAVPLQPFTVDCVLDFFVEKQRQGNGKYLFENFLNSQNVNVESVAFDRPSPKLVSFLTKHFNISDLVFQPNNFVISRKFFVL